MILRIGTRGSALARAQSSLVGESLVQASPSLEFTLHEVVTHGDLSRGSLVGLTETGVFVTALRRSLLDGDCDVLVHSLKDMPVDPFPGLVVAAIARRADARDALCSTGPPLAGLPAGARIGTSSPRRAAQVLALRQDVEVADIRGNVDSRLRQVGGEYDAVVVAAAGLDRLGRLADVTEMFAVDVMVPAPGQGALAIEIREDAPPQLVAAIMELEDPLTRAAVTAERTALAVLQAGCAAPVGAHARVSRGVVDLRVRVVNATGSLALNEKLSGPIAHAESLGRSAAYALLGRGAGALMAASAL